MSLKRLLSAGGLALAMVVAPHGSAEAATTEEVVTPADLGTNWFPADTRPDGTGTFEEGPDTPPLGTASFEMNTPSSPAKVQLLTDNYDGVALSEISALSYSTYRDPASTGFVAGVAALNLRVDTTGDGVPDSYFVYEPYQDQGNAAVQTGVWQTWDAYAAGQAKWWVNTGGVGTCGQSLPCTWDELLTTYPGATIQEAAGLPGSLGFNQGSVNPGIITNVDALSVGVGNDTVTYNFEVIRDLDGDGIADTDPPTTADACKKGAWGDFNNPGFKNQGDCVSYVQTGK